MSSVDLGTAPLSRLFLRYVTPTVAAMLVTGIYVTIDGIFVGHILGQDGLAGMMLAYPICAVLYAVGALIGMGSSSLASFYLGKGEQARARHIVGNALVMVLIASALLAFIGIRYGEAMLVWMGAQGVIFDAGFAYLQWYAWLGVFAVLSMAFTALLRNDGRPGLTTWILVGGGVLNVLLDYLLMAVIPWGLAGAAIATMLSQAVTGGLCLWHFFTPRSQLRIRWDTLVPDWRLMGETLRLGVSSFLMYLYLSVVLRPPVEPSRVPPITLAAGVAVAEAVARFEVTPALKWPNDVQLGGKKVAGILTESAASGSRLEWVVVGIGVNLNVSSNDFPPELAAIATSLSMRCCTGAFSSQSTRSCCSAEAMCWWSSMRTLCAAYAPCGISKLL